MLLASERVVDSHLHLDWFIRVQIATKYSMGQSHVITGSSLGTTTGKTG